MPRAASSFPLSAFFSFSSEAFSSFCYIYSTSFKRMKIYRFDIFPSPFFSPSSTDSLLFPSEAFPQLLPPHPDSFSTPISSSYSFLAAAMHSIYFRAVILACHAILYADIAVQAGGERSVCAAWCQRKGGEGAPAEQCAPAELMPLQQRLQATSWQGRPSPAFSISLPPWYMSFSAFVVALPPLRDICHAAAPAPSVSRFPLLLARCFCRFSHALSL